MDDEDLDSSSKERKKSYKRRGKNKKKGRSSRDSSDDDGLVKIKKGSRKKKWYSSDEDSSLYSSESESDKDEKKRRSKSKNKRDDSPSKMEIARKEMGLDWMLRAQSKKPAVTETEENLSEEVPVEEVCLLNIFPSCLLTHVYIYILLLSSMEERVFYVD